MTSVLPNVLPLRIASQVFIPVHARDTLERTLMRDFCSSEHINNRARMREKIADVPCPKTLARPSSFLQTGKMPVNTKILPPRARSALDKRGGVKGASVPGRTKAFFVASSLMTYTY